MKNPFFRTRAYIVTDLGFGDSGKGITVDYLCKIKNKEKNIVIRTSSGHQCGHTVKIGKDQFMISNFGAGTLRGIPTYYSEGTTMFPSAFLLEREKLSKFNPKVYFHPLTMVTTPYDIFYNQLREGKKKHGSCGVGYGATVVRNMDGITLYVKDLTNLFILKEKLNGIKYWYISRKEVKEEDFKSIDENISTFIDHCIEASKYFEIKLFSEIQDKYNNWIFEGNQGILLDRIEGTYPFNSWSVCTSEAPMEFLKNVNKKIANIYIYYVTRSYQTRHGNGPMSSNKKVDLINNQDESNVPNIWQGFFRTREIDYDILKWSLLTDKSRIGKYTNLLKKVNYNLVVTCLDHLVYDNIPEFLRQFKKYKFSNILGSCSPEVPEKGFKKFN